MVNNISSKAKLRDWSKELRTKLDLQRVGKEIETKIRNLSEYKSAKHVMSYLAKDIEIPLNGLFNDKNKTWFLPVVVDEIVVVPYIPGETKLIKGSFGIVEPEITGDNCFDQLSRKIKLDVILVPGLCFDKDGNRLGFGRGFFDRFLKLNPDSFKIGVCPKECLVSKLPQDVWDIKVDLVLTD